MEREGRLEIVEVMTEANLRIAETTLLGYSTAAERLTLGCYWLRCWELGRTKMLPWVAAVELMSGPVLQMLLSCCCCL
jgi:hypothetical protein